MVAVFAAPALSGLHLNQNSTMNIVTTSIWANIKACNTSWVSLIVVATLIGLLAAVAVPVHVH